MRCLMCHFTDHKSSPGGSVVKKPPVNSGDTGLIPRLGRSTGSPGSPGEMAIHSSIIAWGIPWTEESGGL